MSRRLFILSFASLVLFSSCATAQDVLPEIVVRAPSPIQGGSSTPSPGALPGTLPVVADKFATVTAVPSEELRRSPGATLGDVLSGKPGITGSSFAPGAASRPIVRGLDVNRVGIVENGVGGGGVSDLGEDHGVPIDPITTDQIEVIRGPATLRYGSQSIGGVVSASNNRIPEAAPPRGAAAEVRSAVTSVDAGAEGALLLDAGRDRFAVHADIFGRRAHDYRVPRYPYLTAPDTAEFPFSTQPKSFNDRQPNSRAQHQGGSLGMSHVFDDGFVGAAVVQNNARYRIPGAEGEGHRSHIEARQTKVLGKGEWRAPVGSVAAIRHWWGVTDYRHTEFGLEDPSIPAGVVPHQFFTNKEQEGRVEAQLLPFQLPFAAMTTAVGLQGGHQRLTASGPAEPGLFDSNRNSRIAGYIFNEVSFNEATRAQLAGRVEYVNLSGVATMFPADFIGVPGPLASEARSPAYMPKSLSFGLIQNLAWNLVASVTAQRVERAPKPAELFSRGVHHATETFDIGDPNLKIETAGSFEAGLRRAVGPVRFEAAAYIMRFNGFIYRRFTSNTCDETFDTCAAGPGAELSQTIYSQRDARFRGGEVQVQWDALPVAGGFVGIDAQYDIVRATFTDGSSVPRIPPQRYGGGIYFRNADWFARIGLLRADPQNNIAEQETRTEGYNLLRAEAVYRTVLAPNDFGMRELTVGVVGTNLLNEDVRNHVSFLKDSVLMPGAGVRLFATVTY